MRKLLFFCLCTSLVLSAHAQPIPRVSTFDTLSLSKADTFYVNFTAPGTDVGFDDGELHFPCVYDTSWGYSFWSYGFAYSNMTDTITGSLANQYSAKTGVGYNGSPNYAVAYGANNTIHHNSTGIGGFNYWHGFYITNSTYAYNSMRDGDMFAKKFGGPTANDPDWFKLKIERYSSGTLQGDSVEFYLADFRDPNNANDYIVKDWQWVSLPNWSADSLLLTLSSSDTGQFGMNTPAYYCLDDFTVMAIGDNVTETPGAAKGKIYPNPATDQLFVEIESNSFTQAILYDLSGKMLSSFDLNDKKTAIPTGHLLHGTYLLQLSNGNARASVRFIKQ